MDDVTREAELGTLEACRARIDEIDARLVDLLGARARVSQQVGRLKASDGTPIFAPAREAQVIANVQKRNPGPLPDDALRSIWIEIMSSSSALQRPLRIGYLGPIGSFSYEAAVRRFGQAAVYVPASVLPEVFQLKERGEVDFGVVPVENSIEGQVVPTLDAFVDSPLKACAEVQLPISLSLASPGSLATIERVFCQRVALGQCRHWLAANLPRAEIIEVDSTSKAVEMAKEPHLAGVGPEAAARLNGVPIIARDIQDQSNNFTRFLVIGDRSATATGRDKTAIVFGVRHRPGALHNALRILSEAGLNLTRIESRPSKRQTWEYVFFVDFQGHQDDPKVVAALDELRDGCLFLKILGSWPDEQSSRPAGA